MNEIDPPFHDCDEWGHCMHGPTEENKILATIFKDWPSGKYEPVPGCPLCEEETCASD